MTATTERSPLASGTGPRAAVSIVTRGETYRHLLYLATALPLGVVYLTILVAGLGLGVALTPLVVGVPILVGVLTLARVLADVERGLANRLLDAGLVAPSRRVPEPGYLAAVRTELTDPASWTALAFLLAKLPFGVAAFGLLASTAALTGGLLATPLYYDALGVDVQLLGLVVDTPVEAAVCVPLGLLVGLASLHVTSAVARLSGRVAGAFLAGGA